MKITKENLELPCELKEKIVRKLNTSRIDIEFINGTNFIFENTNLIVTKPSIIIFSNDTQFIKIFNYGNEELFIDDYNTSIALVSLITLVNNNL